MGVYAQEDVFILGIRRSGNHAIANWLIPHYEGIVRYFNDYAFAEQMRPESTCLEGDPTKVYLTMNGQTFALLNKGQTWTLQAVVAREFAQQMRQKGHFLRNLCYPPSAIERDINRMSIQHITSNLPYWVADDSTLEAHCNIFGCENQTPENMAATFPVWQKTTYHRILQHIGATPASQLTYVVLLRNPFNNLASLMKCPLHWPINHIPYQQFPETWIAFAKEYLGDTSYLSSTDKVIMVNYDQWFEEQAYRKKLSQQFNQPFRDTGFQKISADGIGSSFDQLRFANNAQQMRVLERWKLLKDNPEYVSLLKNEELLSLYKRIYGDPPFVL